MKKIGSIKFVEYITCNVAAADHLGAVYVFYFIFILASYAAQQLRIKYGHTNAEQKQIKK